MSLFVAPTESPDEPRRLRTVWRFLIFGVGYILLQIILAVGLVAVLVGWLILSGGFEDAGPREFAELAETWMVPLNAILAAPVAALALGLCVLCRLFLDRRPATSMGLVRPVRGLTTGIVPGFLFGVAPIVLASLGLLAVGGFRFEGLAVPVQALYMAPAFVFLAFHEEIVMRGYLLQNLVDVRRKWFGVLFTSVLFWLMHGFNPGAWGSPVVAVNLFGAGVLLALAYLVSGNIWFPTAIHFGWNLAQGVILSIPVSGVALEGFVKLERTAALSDLLTGGEFGLEGSVIISALEVVMILILLRALQLRRDREAGEAEEFAASHQPDAHVRE